MGLFYLTTLLVILIAAIYGLLIKLASGTTGSGLIVMLLVQQGFILSTIWVRMVYLGGQLSFYRDAMDVPRWAEPAGPSGAGDESAIVIDEGALLANDLSGPESES
jgi:hypothetical protein